MEGDLAEERDQVPSTTVLSETSKTDEDREIEQCEHAENRRDGSGITVVEEEGGKEVRLDGIDSGTEGNETSRDRHFGVSKTVLQAL